jgi:hypothetical protein
MFAVGLSQGPPHHYWYLLLDRLVPRKDIRGVLIKILLDQVYLINIQKLIIVNVLSLRCPKDVLMRNDPKSLTTNATFVEMKFVRNRMFK